MKILPHRTIVAAALASLLGFAGAAQAQSNPSADDIIKSLKPSGGTILGGTRGIRPAKPAAGIDSGVQSAAASSGPAAPRKRVPAQAATSEPTVNDNPSVSLTVQFATGSAQLTPAAIHTLDELGRALSSAALSTYHFRIEGHTDTVGSKDLNKILSEKRAQAVVAYLSAHYGVTPDRLQAAGLGSDGLAVPTPDQTPEPRNRRVQVINLGA